MTISIQAARVPKFVHKCFCKHFPYASGKHLGAFAKIWVHPEASANIWGHLRPLGASGTIREELAVLKIFCNIWQHLEIFGSLWQRLGISENIRKHLVRTWGSTQEHLAQNHRFFTQRPWRQQTIFTKNVNGRCGIVGDGFHKVFLWAGETSFVISDRSTERCN